ncbi:cuticle protein 21-like [Palaemon carinicauda]|uniref:cuticle protein 21-like n=1 Tax=Palaemon carinicauda TaxID=392227 RepID=UPI0035B63E00
MAIKVIFFLVSLGAVMSQYTSPPEPYGEEEPQGPAQYSFKYDVNDPDSEVNFDHGEKRDGPQAQGSYSVKLPDSRVQRVTYTVDGDSGYVAEVTYEGNPSPSPSYGQA